MVHIILTILKILGIMLLCILGVIIVVLATVLFAPFRYSLDARKGEHASIKESVLIGKVTWMWFFLRCRYIYENGQTQLKIRILGIDIERFKSLKKILDKKKKNTSNSINKKENVKIEKQNYSDNVKTVNAENNKKIIDNNSETSIDSVTDAEVKENFITKLKTKINDIKNKLKALKSKILGIKDKIKEIINKISFYKEELEKEENKTAIKFAWGKIKEVLNHIKPRKLKGNITFGMESPDKTGQALGIVAIFYPIYGDNFTIKPNFYEGCLYGDFIAKGRIRLFTLVVICIKLIRSNEFKKLRKLIGK